MNDVQPRPVSIRPPLVESAQLADSGLDPVLQRVYAARGVSGVAELDYGLKGLLPVSSLSGIDTAVALLHAVGIFQSTETLSSALISASCGRGERGSQKNINISSLPSEILAPTCWSPRVSCRSRAG